MRKRILSFALAVVLVCTLLPQVGLTGKAANAQGDGSIISVPATGGNLYFDPAAGAIVDCDETVTDAEIPESVESVPVTNIAAGAFSDCDIMESLTIPASVTDIEDYALTGCFPLKSITFLNPECNIGENYYGMFEYTTVYGYAGSTAETSARINALVFESLDDNTVSGIGGNDVFWTLDRETGRLTISGSGDMYVYSFGGGPWYEYLSEITMAEIGDGVTSIGDYAFCNCERLSSVEIGSNISRIGDSAFYNCWELRSVSIPENVRSIGEYAFADTGLYSVVLCEGLEEIGPGAFCPCYDLQQVTIPASVTIIGDDAFSGGDRFYSITVDEGNANYSSLNGVLFNKEQTELIACPSGKSGRYQIPDSVISIADDAFYACRFSSITIPDSVRSIGDMAFCSCRALTEITIPDSVTAIGEDAFMDCYALTSVTVLNPECSISPYSLGFPDTAVIYGYTGSTAQTFADECGYTFVPLDEPGNTVSGACGENASWSLDRETGVLTISGSGPMDDFIRTRGGSTPAPWGEYSTDITEVVIEEGVTSIGDYAFAGCENLTDVSIPDSVTRIGEHAFDGCSSLTELTVPNPACIFPDALGLPDGAIIYGYAGSTAEIFVQTNFGYIFSAVDANIVSGACYYNLSWSLNRDTGVLTISGTGEMDLEVQNGQHIGPWREYKEEIRSVQIEEGVTNIESSAFSGFTNLTSVTIPDGITSIGMSAFWGCTSLTEIVIPDGVTSIGHGVFSECTGLETIVFPDSIESVGDNVIYNTAYYNDQNNWDNGLLYIGKCLIKANNTITAAQIRSDTKVIADDAFYRCSALTEITIPENVKTIGASAFYNCAGLTTVILPEGLTLIGSNAFHGCYALSDISIPNSVTTIYNDAFNGCISLSEINIPENLITIDQGVFSNCTSLTSIVIPDSVTLISYRAFSGCTNLTSVTIPESVIYIKSMAFRNCASLTKITILNPICDIDDNSWYYPSYVLGDPDKTTIYGHPDSTAQAYAELYGYTFIPLDPCTYGIHDYESVVTDPTCTEEGYTTYSCAVCGDSYIDDYVEALGHSFADGVCTRCGAVDPEYGEASLTIYAEHMTAEPGSELKVPVMISGGAGFAGFTLTFTTSEGLALKDIEKGALLKEADGSLTKNIAQGLVNWISTEDFSGEGELLVLTFDVDETVEDDTELTVSIRLKDDKITNFANAFEQPISVRFEDIAITVKSTVFGDVNGDGEVDTIDTIRLVRFLVDLVELTPEQWKASDVNHDGDVTTTDAIRLARYLVGLVDTLDETTRGASAPPRKGRMKHSATIRVGEVTCESGGTVKVPVMISEHPGFAGFTLAIGSADGLTLKSIEKGDLLKQADGIFTGNTSGGYVNWTGTENVEGNGELMILTFQVDEDEAQGDYPITLALKDDVRSNFVNADEEQISVSFTAGKISCEKADSSENDFRFEDVKDDKAFYYDAVYWAYRAETQITKGTDAVHFSPEDVCTRGQVVTFLWRAAGCPEPKDNSTEFVDVAEDAFYAKAIAWAVENGITKGTSLTTFAPDASCTRGQIVTFLWRCSDKPEPTNTDNPFADVKADQYYYKAVLWALEKEITKGTSDTRFSPDSTCTRGQIVTFLHRGKK